MSDGAPALEVGFIIDTGGSFNELQQLQQAMGSAEAKVVAEAKRIEQATAGMVNLGGATAQVRTFGAAATVELAAAERASNRAEKAGEALSRQMERQAATFGMTRAAAAALVAEQNGLTELAARLRSQEAGLMAMREQAAAATQREADAAKRAAASHAELAAKVQGSMAAQLADADAAERLRMSTDPLYAATQRLNAEIAESTRLYYAGATAPAEYARQQEVLTGRLQAAERQFATTGTGIGNLGATGKLAGHHMTNLAYQFQDLGVQMTMAAQSSAPVKMALMAIMQQGSQISMIMSQAGIGIRGVAGAFGTMAKNALMAVATNPYVIAFGVAAGAAALAVRGLSKAANEGADGDMKAYAASLGLTAKEIRNLDNVSVTTGDTMKAVFQVAGRAIWGAIGPAVTSVWDTMKDWLSWIGSGVKSAVNFLIGGFVGAYNAIKKTWSMFPAALGDIFFSAVNASITAINALIKRSVEGINSFISSANGVLGKFGLALPSLSAPEIATVKNQYAGAAKAAGKAWSGEMSKAMGVDYLGDFGRKAGKAIIDQARQNARDRIKDQAEAKGYLDPEKAKKPPKPKTDSHAEQLARENEAIEAQIKNLYALADAYNVSGAAALIAEARVKAESDAIKKRGDIEMFVDRQIRLAIAQRVSDGAKATATMREQTAAQKQVNDLVAAGLMPAERAAELVKDKIADLPLLAAIEAAQQRGLASDAARATIELERQRKARADANAEAARAKALADTASANDQLDRLRLEASLINATNQERAVSIAQLEVEQYLRANPGIGKDDAEKYRTAKVAVAEMTVALSSARSEADLLIASLQGVADQTSVAAEIMSNAFGNFGSVLGSMAENMAAYQAAQAQMSKEVRNGTKTQAEADKALGVLRVRNNAAAITGVKSLFKEHSTAYKAMSAIEKAYAAFQAVQTALSIARDIAKTTSHVVNSGVRTAANTAEGGSKIFAELGPFAFPVVAAMVAVLAALGAKGGSGVGGGPSIPSAEDLQKGAGTGTVLGDTQAKSESIARSLELMAANTNRDLEYSNAMLQALKSIDTSIARMAGTVARQIQVAGSMFDTSGLGLGESSKKGFLGLFGGSSTTKTLQDLGINLNSSTVGNIIANGISGSTYQTVQSIKTKKGFLGIGGGTKTSYSTTTGAISGDITSAIQDVILSLRNGLIAGADLIGVPGAQAILDSFQVSLGKISFKGMTGKEIEDQLNAIFSSVGDKMAGALVPSLSSMQLVGEGMFETFMRVAKEFQAVDIAMKSIGRTFGQVGFDSIAARDALVQLMGGLDEFMNAADFFRENFLTEAQQMAPIIASVADELARLGMGGINTREQFRDTVLALDLTTDAGRTMFASLMALAPAFDKVMEQQEKAQQEAVKALQQTLDTFKQLADGLRKYRDTLFAMEATQAGAYGALRSRFLTTAAQAATGDKNALGGLESAGKAFLDAARNNASTREDYLRDVALVAQAVDSGIFAADAAVDYAQLQIDAQNHANGLLAAIAANTAASAAALAGTALPPSTPATSNLEATGSGYSNSNPSSSQPAMSNDDVVAAIEGLRADQNAGMAYMGSYNKRMALILERASAEGDGALAITGVFD